jgi:tryptophan synthase beta chain
VRFSSVLDEEVLAAVSRTARSEGVLPALESAHALALAYREASDRDTVQGKGAHPIPTGDLVIVNVSGRGDKDLFITAPIFDRADWLGFLEDEAARIRAEDGEKEKKR